MTPVCNRSRKVLVFSVVECVTPVCNTSRKVLVFSVVNEFMSDIKKVDLGGGASIYIYIYMYSPLSALTCSGRNSVKFATGSWMYSNSCLEGANGWRPQATQANYRASLLIATTTPEKNIIVTIWSLLTIPPKSGNQKNRLGEQTRFKQNHGSWQFIFIYHISV